MELGDAWDTGPDTLEAVPKGMLLLLLSHISPVRLRATPQMAAHQAPQSLGFSTVFNSHKYKFIGFNILLKW